MLIFKKIITIIFIQLENIIYLKYFCDEKGRYTRSFTESKDTVKNQKKVMIITK